jgi:c-di-GMP-binding flagellar brake protein YcgR
MGEIFMDTREYERKAVEADISGSIEEIEGFHLRDLSQSGALIRTLEQLKMGKDYLIKFKLSNGDHIDIKSRIIRCSLVSPHTAESDKKEPLYEVGLKFIEPAKDSLQKLSRFISDKEVRLS